MARCTSCSGAHPARGRFQAHLFDCDGTIADSMAGHFLAWQQALEWGGVLPEELFHAWGGRPSRTSSPA